MKKITVKINVTDRDIRLGKPRSGYWCPIARAFKRALRRAGTATDLVSAGPVWLQAYDKTGRRLVGANTGLCGFWRGCETPEVLTKFMQDFDRGSMVKPLSHTLELEVIG